MRQKQMMAVAFLGEANMHERELSIILGLDILLGLEAVILLGGFKQSMVCCPMYASCMYLRSASFHFGFEKLHPWLSCLPENSLFPHA